jgi:hypothetical protein
MEYTLTQSSALDLDALTTPAFCVSAEKQPIQIAAGLHRRHEIPYVTTARCGWKSPKRNTIYPSVAPRGSPRGTSTPSARLSPQGCERST